MDQVKVLREAFMKMVKDSEFQADTEKNRLDVTPSSGERVQSVVEKLYATPKETIKRAKDIISPPA